MISLISNRYALKLIIQSGLVLNSKTLLVEWQSAKIEEPPSQEHVMPVIELARRAKDFRLPFVLNIKALNTFRWQLKQCQTKYRSPSSTSLPNGRPRKAA
jgi:hypothetical protein